MKSNHAFFPVRRCYHLLYRTRTPGERLCNIIIGKILLFLQFQLQFLLFLLFSSHKCYFKQDDLFKKNDLTYVFPHCKW